MNGKQLQTMSFGKKMTSIGLFIGFIIFFASFFVNGVIHAYILSIGLSVMVTSMLLFGFGMFLMLMQEVSDSRHRV